MNWRPDIGSGMNAGSYVSRCTDVRRDTVGVNDRMTIVQKCLSFTEG